MEKELDEMDIIMSQIDCNTLVEVNQPEMDEMDIIMSQMDDNVLLNTDANVSIVETSSDVDAASNFATEELETITLDQIPDELIDEYRSAINELDEEMVNEMGNEPDDDDAQLPPELLEEFQSAMDQILPVKSGNRYLQAYEVFRKWLDSYRVRNISEEIVMVYFVRASRNYKPPTLWSMYSMLKKTFIVKHNIDLKTHCRLRAFLKTKSDGYIGKKSNVFTQDEIQKFIVEAPIHIYLGMKVISETIGYNFLYFHFYFSFSR